MKFAIPDHLLRLPPIEALGCARELGFDGLELTLGAYTAESHPLLDADGASDLAKAADAAGVPIASASAGFITRWGLIDSQLPTRQKSLDYLERLLEGCRTAAIPLVHLPCHGASEPRSRSEQLLLVEVLRPLARRASELGVTLALETLEPADTCRDWLRALSNDFARAAYDVGDARAANREVVPELQLLGSALGLVRLRDRSRREPFATVPLGGGSVDLGAVMRTLQEGAFAGWLVVEGPSGTSPLEAARENLKKARAFLSPPTLAHVVAA